MRFNTKLADANWVTTTSAGGHGNGLASVTLKSEKCGIATPSGGFSTPVSLTRSQRLPLFT